jgi:hypothetical protein
VNSLPKKPVETGTRPAPGKEDPVWSFLRTSSGAEYKFEVYRGDGSDEVYFVDPRDDPQPYELRDGSLDLGLTRERMTELRDLFTYLLDNWGQPWARQSHPEEEK